MAVEMLGWARDIPRLSASAQAAELTAYGVTDWGMIIDGRHVKGRSKEDWAWMLKKVRPGDTLAVVDLRALAGCPAAKQDTPGRALLRCVREVEAVGVRIIEISTGLRLWIKAEREEAFLGARDRMSKAASGAAAGRHKRKFTDAQRQFVLNHWLSLKYNTDKEAAEGLQADVKAKGIRGISNLTYPQIIARHFGKSGRLGKKPKPKR